jgi:dihydrofolate reductase
MNLITCISLNHCIGKEGKLAVRIPEDLKRFKKLTTGNIVVMGANTFFGDLEGKPLPNRINVVLTKKTATLNLYGSFPTNLYFVESIPALSNILNSINSKKSKEVFIMGGAAIYNQFMGLVDTLYITHTNSIVKEGDSFFNIDWSKWNVEEVEFSEQSQCTFVKYVRKY